MLQFAIKLCFDDADAEFVIWCGSINARFQIYCTNDREILVLVAKLNRYNESSNFEKLKHFHLHDL